MLLQISVAGVPGVQVWGTPPTQLFTVLRQAPTPHVVVPRLLSTVPSQSSSMLLQNSVAGVPGVQVWGTPPTQAGAARGQGPPPPGSVPRPPSSGPRRAVFDVLSAL